MVDDESEDWAPRRADGIPRSGRHPASDAPSQTRNGLQCCFRAKPLTGQKSQIQAMGLGWWITCYQPGTLIPLQKTMRQIGCPRKSWIQKAINRCSANIYSKRFNSGPHANALYPKETHDNYPGARANHEGGLLKGRNCPWKSRLWPLKSSFCICPANADSQHMLRSLFAMLRR